MILILEIALSILHCVLEILERILLTLEMMT